MKPRPCLDAADTRLETTCKPHGGPQKRFEEESLLKLVSRLLEVKTSLEEIV